MEKNQLWLEREIRNVEFNYTSNPLYRVLHHASLKCVDKVSESFYVRPIELFYHTIYSLDIIRGIAEKEERLMVCSDLWAELYAFFSDSVESGERDKKTAANLVALAVGFSLSAADSLLYNDEIMALFVSVQNHATYDPLIMASWLTQIDSDRKPEVRQWVKQYMAGDEFISDTIEDIVMRLRKQADLEAKEQAIAEKANTVYINSIHVDNRKEFNVLSAYITEEQISEILNRPPKNNQIDKPNYTQQ